MVLGQLYTVKHDAKKAEEQFKTAQAIEPDSEEVVLNLARLYAESGDMEHAAKVIEAVPVADRTAKMEDALGAAYEQLKRPKDAIAAYQRATDMEPGDLRTLDALAQALLNDNQLDEALKQYQELAEADPENAGALVHIGEIQRRQGKYEDALATIRKARKMEPDNLEAGYNEGLLLDVLGRYDEAAQVYEKMVDLTSHANGAYTAEEKNNRGIFLERLGAVYHEQNKTAEAIATYQKTDRHGRRAGGARLPVPGGHLARRQAVRQGGRGGAQGGRGQPQGSRPEADAGRGAGRPGQDRRRAGDGQGAAGQHRRRPPGLAGAGPDVRPRAPLEGGRGRLRQGRGADHQERKTAPTLLFLRGELAERQKHYEPAEQFFRQALELEPDSAMTLNYLGYMLADKGKQLPEALKMIRKAVELEPMNGAYLDSLGWVYFKMGEYELAEENLRQAVERDQTDPTVHDHLGELYEKTGRIRLAAAQWELSLAQSAKSAAADVEPAEVAKVQKKLESARVKLAKEESAVGQAKPE